MSIDIGRERAVFVVGAGIMGAGIAQIAAQAGHPVRLYDAREGAAAGAVGKLAATLDGLAAKGKLDPAEARAVAARVSAASRLDEAAGSALVIEAIVENAAAKTQLFRDLEASVGEDCLLASNTSSISITALAAGLRLPRRFVGMHFFNPVPLMKLVEVVSGLQTDTAVAEAIFDLSKRWGKTPVHARSTPGFIVNRIARPYYAETLALLLERAAEPAAIDACLRGAGFRMGPCELMDLIGHDTNFAVTQSVFEANFGDKRYAPSLIQRELVDGGLLGRKSGRGFFVHPLPASAAAPAFDAPEVPAGAIVALHGTGCGDRTLGGPPRGGRRRLRGRSGEPLDWPADRRRRAAPGRRPRRGAGGRRGRAARRGPVRSSGGAWRRAARHRARLLRRGERLAGLARAGAAVAPHRRLDGEPGGRRARPRRRPAPSPC
jgi:3-hydroxybutyryl-CoA dehydrogenase